MLQKGYDNQTLQLQSLIKEKYKQVHSLFEEIKRERSFRTFSVAKPKKNKKDLVPQDNNEKLIVLKEQVQLLRSEVTKFEQQISKIENDRQKVKR